VSTLTKGPADGLREEHDEAAEPKPRFAGCHQSGGEWPDKSPSVYLRHLEVDLGARSAGKGPQESRHLRDRGGS
jgi:hypothetical protein